MLDVKKKYISIGERRRIERKKEQRAAILMLFSAMAMAVMGVYGLDKELEFREKQNKCWAEEAQTGKDLDCQDDETW
jgi:hypothetical protein